MGLPRNLVNINAYKNGVGYLGVISEFEQPKLAIETEDYRGGGMLGAIKLDKPDPGIRHDQRGRHAPAPGLRLSR